MVHTFQVTDSGNNKLGDAVNHLPKKFSQVAQISTKQHGPYWHMKVPSSSLNYVAIKKTFGKIVTTVVLDKDENLS